MASALTGAEDVLETGVLETDAQASSALLTFPQEPALSEMPSHEGISPSHCLFLKGDEERSSAFSSSREQNARSVTPVSLATSTGIAAAIARPLSSLNADHAPFGSVSLPDMQALARHPFFTGPVNRAAARLSGLSDISIDKGHLRRLGHSSASQISLLLATGAPDLAQEASQLVGAIVLHKHLLARALKADREQLQQLLGEDIYRIATREAPVLHAPMADLDDGSFSIHPAFSTNPARVSETGLRLIAVGQRVLHDFVQMTEPSLSSLLAFRQSPQPHSERDQHKTTVMTDRHSVHIIRLLRRRFEPWLHTIG